MLRNDTFRYSTMSLHLLTNHPNYVLPAPYSEYESYWILVAQTFFNFLSRIYVRASNRWHTWTKEENGFLVGQQMTLFSRSSLRTTLTCIRRSYVMRYTVWHDLYNLRNVKTPMEECKNNTPPWVFFAFFKLYKWTNGTKSRKTPHISVTHMIVLYTLKLDLLSSEKLREHTIHKSSPAINFFCLSFSRIPDAKICKRLLVNLSIQNEYRKIQKKVLHIWTCFFAVKLFSTKMRVHLKIYIIKYSRSLDTKKHWKDWIMYKMEKSVVNLPQS